MYIEKVKHRWTLNSRKFDNCYRQLSLIIGSNPWKNLRSKNCSYGTILRSIIKLSLTRQNSDHQKSKLKNAIAQTLSTVQMDLSLSLFGPCSETRNIVSLFSNIEHKKRLPPEPQTGNVEYKLKLVNPSKNRLEHLITQLNWRLHEGRGRAIYEIGVEDNGMLRGISEDEMSNSLYTLETMAIKLGAKTEVLREHILDSGRKIAEVLVTMSIGETNFI